MFMLCPALGMSQYKAPIAGLYLTGASTHPGEGGDICRAESEKISPQRRRGAEKNNDIL
ncbi:MAG: hypothetical protein SGI73_01980 [Chloroflexota bacterium]|nr:hypothetical protein [Chloroflexota bacterium]